MNMKIISFSLATALVLASCASSIKKYDYPSTTNASEEISRLDGEMNSANERQLNVLSPDHYADAKKKLDEAKKEITKKDSNEDTLKDLGYARAHLDAANATATKVEAAIPEVLKARKDAIAANAQQLNPEALKKADSDLMDTTSDYENGKGSVSVKRVAELTDRFRNVELISIKSANLGESKRLIESAKEMGAYKLAKKTLAAAESKYQAADSVINTDRHNQQAVAAASANALAEAKRVDQITRAAKLAKNGTPEEIALVMEQQNLATAAGQKLAAQRGSQLSTAEGRIRTQSAVIGATTAENAKLEEQKRFNEAFTTAQQNFSKDEAEVYRQGDKLLIRLKKMQFTSGKSQLPADSLSVLGKVKDVIETMGAEKILVEGHTDTVGSKAANMKLSETRAKAIGEYLVSVNAVSQEQVETKGFGFDKPITTNKTAAGRAQNRRVDVIITPPGAHQSHNTNSVTE